MDSFKELATEMINYYTGGYPNSYIERFKNNLKGIGCKGSSINVYICNSEYILMTIDMTSDVYSTSFHEGQDINYFVNKDDILKYFIEKITDTNITVGGVITDKTKKVLFIKNGRTNFCWSNFNADNDFNLLTLSLYGGQCFKK